MNLLSETDPVFLKISTALHSLGKVDPGLIQVLPDLMEEWSVKGREYLLAMNQVCRHVWYIETGFVRWYLQLNGHDFTTYITRPGNIILHEGFYAQRSTPLLLQALKGGCRTCRINYEMVKKYQGIYPTTYALSTNLSNQIAIEKSEFQHQIAEADIYQRYSYIAEYLGSKYFNALKIEDIAPLINVDRSTLYRWLPR